jgi:hypothetical protein
VWNPQGTEKTMKRTDEEEKIIFFFLFSRTANLNNYFEKEMAVCMCVVLGANGWAIRIFISPRLTTNPTAASGIDVRVSLKILFLCGCLSVHTRRSS